MIVTEYAKVGASNDAYPRPYDSNRPCNPEEDLAEMKKNIGQKTNHA